MLIPRKGVIGVCGLEQLSHSRLLESAALLPLNICLLSRILNCSPTVETEQRNVVQTCMALAVRVASRGTLRRGLLQGKYEEMGIRCRAMLISMNSSSASRRVHQTASSRRHTEHLARNTTLIRTRPSHPPSSQALASGNTTDTFTQRRRDVTKEIRRNRRSIRSPHRTRDPQNLRSIRPRRPQTTQRRWKPSRRKPIRSLLSLLRRRWPLRSCSWSTQRP